MWSNLRKTNTITVFNGSCFIFHQKILPSMQHNTASTKKKRWIWERNSFTLFHTDYLFICIPRKFNISRQQSRPGDGKKEEMKKGRQLLNHAHMSATIPIRDAFFARSYHRTAYMTSISTGNEKLLTRDRICIFRRNNCRKPSV